MRVRVDKLKFGQVFVFVDFAHEWGVVLDPTRDACGNIAVGLELEDGFGHLAMIPGELVVCALPLRSFDRVEPTVYRQEASEPMEYEVAAPRRQFTYGIPRSAA
jgi:hypothetical protein